VIAISHKVHITNLKDIYGREARAPLEPLNAGPALWVDAGSGKERSIEVAIAADATNYLVQRNLFVVGTEFWLGEIEVTANLIK
jgi:hypothetical protein